MCAFIHTSLVSPGLYPSGCTFGLNQGQHGWEENLLTIQSRVCLFWRKSLLNPALSLLFILHCDFRFQLWSTVSFSYPVVVKKDTSNLELCWSCQNVCCLFGPGLAMIKRGHDQKYSNCNYPILFLDTIHPTLHNPMYQGIIWGRSGYYFLHD